MSSPLHPEVAETRKTWEIKAWQDDDGLVHVRISDPVGWGNAHPRDLGQHWGAMMQRAKRRVRRFARPYGPYPLVVEKVHQYGDNVTYAVTFKEEGVAK